MRIHRIIALVFLASSLTSCAGLSLRESGFLDHYEQLKPAPEAKVWGIPDDVELYRVDDLHGKYDKIIIEPPVYHEVKGAKHHPTKRRIGKIEATYAKCLRKHLGKDFEIVDTPSPRTARIRASISEVNPQKVWLNIIGIIILTPVDMGGIVGEMEVLDSVTGERQFAMVARRDGTIFLLLESFEKYGHARHGMRKWAEFVGKEMKAPEG